MKKKWKGYFPHEGMYVKILRIMKLCTCLLLCTVMSISASVRAQHARVNLDLKDATLEEVIWTLEKKSEITFFYNVADVAKIKGLDVSFKNASLEDVLDEVLKGTGLYYQIHDNVVVVKVRTIVSVDSLKNERITGFVRDEAGLPLPGVSVLIKGTSVGVSTDKDGKFTLVVPDLSDAVIIVSFIGMKTQVVPCSQSKKK